MPPKKKKQQGVGAHCSVLLKYLHLKQKINEVIPLNARRNKQELDECVVVSRETRNIKRKPKICIVLKHESFSDNHIYCAERYASSIAESLEETVIHITMEQRQSYILQQN
jgi:hypothetical protein